MGTENAGVDNGLYVKGYINEKAVNFLLDSGSTATLISKNTFDKLGIESLSVRNKNISIHGADGSNIKIYGKEQFQINLGQQIINHPVIVCNITTDGIIGQDFILKHAKQLDFDNLELVLRTGERVQCYACHEAYRVCRVTVREEIKIPPQSYAFVSVVIPDNEQLPPTGFVENIKDTNASFQVIEGLVEPHRSKVGVGVINKGEKSIYLKPGVNFAYCKSSYEEVNDAQYCAKVLMSNTKDDEYHKHFSANCAETNANGLETPTVRAEEKGDAKVGKVNAKVLGNSASVKDSHDGKCESVIKDENNGGLPDYLMELLDRSSVHLDIDQICHLKALLRKFQDVFVASSDDLGCTDKVRHKINTGDAQPIKQAPRRQPLGKRQNEIEEVERMLQKGIIEPSDSEWSSPVVLVTKKDGSTRFCVDYRRLNSVTKVDAYPIPRVDDCLEALVGNSWFSSMDLCSGFWQVKMDENDIYKTAFSTSSNGMYHFKVMPFGLVNSPATFQRLMENVLRGLQWVQSLLYIDDIITPGKTVGESLARLENVFVRLQEYNLKLKASKCIFFQKSITFLGHVVSEEGISTDDSKISTIKTWPIPQNQKEVRSFLGLTGYYRKFVKGYADIARPLHKLCEKKAKYIWDDSCKKAFDNLKLALTTAPILAYPRPECQFILDTDASHDATGAVLSQIIDGNEHAIAYMSKTMNQHEKQYCITRKELLAVVRALKHFHHYLYGRQFLLRTDNSAVSWMQSLKVPTGQTARWLQELSTYSMTVTHMPGRSHNNADALSRRPCNACARQQNLNDTDKCESEKADGENVAKVRVTRRNDSAKVQESELTQNQWLLDGWSPVDVQNNQLSDPNIGPILSAKLNNSDRPSWSKVSSGKANLKTLWRQWDRLEVKGGMIYRRFETDNKSHILQLILPGCKRKDVFYFYHDIPAAGHLGFDKTLGKV